MLQNVVSQQQRLMTFFVLEVSLQFPLYNQRACAYDLVSSIQND